MKKLKFTTVIVLCLFCNNAHTQSIDDINNALDNIYYYNYYAINFDYNTHIQLPDSTKQKVISVLNGYLPPQKIKERTTFNDISIKEIEKRAKNICGEDSICNALAKDSIIQHNIERQLTILRQAVFPEKFILAIGAWNVKEAELILLENINNNPKYPQRETLLALARLGNDSIYKRVMEKYTINYVINNTVYQDDDPDLMYKSIPSVDLMSHKISDFYNAGVYLKNKEILLNIIDLLDIQGKTPDFDSMNKHWSPIEDNDVLTWLATRFMTKENLENGKYYEWEKIIDNYSYSISKYKNTDKIKEILSKENKEIIKRQLKDWIDENVNFEE